MIQRYNIQKLLHTAKEEKNLLDKLTISEDEEKLLLKLRKKIRSALRQGFNKLRDKSHTFETPEQQYIAQLKPKFCTQGSFVYRTLNSPAYVPPQQIDLDDGVYFPMKVVEDSPKAAKHLLFDLVDKMLKKLASFEGWEFDDSKPTCARLNINQRIHIDIPIYAIPEDRYIALAACMDSSMISNESLREAKFILDPNQVYLAMRNKEHWKPSDPMELRNWFEARCALYPRRLRRVCRYLKAWRDHTWQKGGPPSITLMVAVANIFDDNINQTKKQFDSDCQALLAVARALSDQFSGQITNPTDSEEIMFPRGQSNEVVLEIQNKVSLFQRQIESALCRSDSQQKVIDKLVEVFGERVPHQPSWVQTITIAAAVRKLPAQPQNEPEPPRNMRSA